VTLHNHKVMKNIAKIKILREYWIPVCDPAGTLSIVGPNNQLSIRMYITLRGLLKKLGAKTFTLQQYMGYI